MDWWSLGIVTFELLIGHTPFVSSSNEGISDRAHRCRIQNEQPRLAKLCHQNMGKVTDLIQKLLIKDPEKRLGRTKILICFSTKLYSTTFLSHFILMLGAGQTGFRAVKKHPFFR